MKQIRIVPGRFEDDDSSFTDGQWVEVSEHCIVDNATWNKIEASCRKFVPSGHRMVAARNYSTK